MPGIHAGQIGYKGFFDNKTELDLEDDAAYVNWGSGWRMPTEQQIYELQSECEWTWAILSGVDGYKVTGPNGNFIFLPAAGCRIDSSLCYAGSIGHYWSSSLFASIPYYAYYLDFNSDLVEWYYYGDRYYGRSVRPVCP